MKGDFEMASSTLYDCVSDTVDSTAVIAPGERLPVIFSHRELRRQILSLQKKLAKIGITQNDRVAIALPNSIELVVSFFSITFQRAVCAPLNPSYKQSEFEFYLNDLGAALLLLPKGAIDANGEAARAAKACDVAVAEISWDWCEVALPEQDLKTLAKRSPAELNVPEPQDIALILHTSGTTGRPKMVGNTLTSILCGLRLMWYQVPLSHENLCSTMCNIQSTYSLTNTDRTLLVMPLFHVHGLLAAFLTPLMSRGSIILPDRFSASEFWNDFVSFGANWFTAVPTMHQILLKNKLPSPMPSIRFVRSCSSPLAPTVHRALEKAFNAPVIEAYAMTEAAHQMTSNPLTGMRKPGSVGIPQGIKLKIKDEAGNNMPNGIIGEVSVKGSNVTAGYLGGPDIVQQPFTPAGYLRTGDQGYLDKDGYLFLTGRIKELINKGGEKISPIEIDNVLAHHPCISEAVSFAIDDALYGQEIAAAVVLREGAQLPAAELQAWCGERMVKFKIPKKVRFPRLEYSYKLLCQGRTLGLLTCSRKDILHRKNAKDSYRKGSTPPRRADNGRIRCIDLKW